MRCECFLSEADLERARRIADIRNSKNGEVPNYRVTRKHSDWEIDFAGARAEIAIARRFHYPEDEHFSYHGDSGAPDLYVGDFRVEVKAATYDPPILKLNALTDFKSDVIILCYVRPAGDPKESIVDACGIVSRRRFTREHYQRDFGMGMRVCMDASTMRSLEEFEEYIKEASW